MMDYNQFTNIPIIGSNEEYFFYSDRYTKSIFSQATYQFNSAAKYYLGVRYEYTPLYQSYGYNPSSSFGRERGEKQSLTSRFAVVIKINNRHSIKAMYGEASRLSDDTFEPEEFDTHELMHTFTNDTLNISTNVFHSLLSGLVVRERNISGNFPQQAIGEISINGVETIIIAEISPALSSEVGLTYQSSRNNNATNIAVAYSPKSILHGKLVYSAEKNIFSITSRYVSSMLPSYDSENSQRIGNKIAGYLVLDGNYRIKNLYKDIFLNIRVTNILNEEIRYPNNPESNGSGGNAMNRGTLGPKREYTLNVGWMF